MAVRTVPAAASSWVAERLAGPRRRCPVVGQTRHAVYVDIDGDCVGVLARAGVALPIGLRTTLPWLPETTGSAEVGGGTVAFGGTEAVGGYAAYAVAVTRLVDPTVPRLTNLPRSAAELSGTYGPRGQHLPDNLVGMPAAAMCALAEAEAGAALDLLGRGDGLTPAGDDVLAGWLVARHAAGLPRDAVAEQVGAHAAARTTPLSATLLHRAIEGEALPQVRDLLVALHAGTDADRALASLRAVGHSSGVALALGISLGLEGRR